ncbi:MAG TPA: class I SAM-dependent methyltransferase [Candidatus Nanoarchaeia archaeon]|nr:class I SAM-dependent methyltransferase [Candidatus Nanoarchaeia archaeon]
MKHETIYKELAKYYDLVYHWKNYKKEAATIRKIISKYKKSNGRDLLDVACGTANHLTYLKKYFSCTGLDISESMLSIARKKHPKLKFYRGDMRNFNLGRKYDIIICLFSAVGHLLSYEDVKMALYTFSNHLKKNGIIIIEPFIGKKHFIRGMANMETYEGKNIKISRQADSVVKRSIANVNLHYLISEKGKKVKYVVHGIKLNMFTPEKYLFYMKKADLDAHFLKKGLMKGRGLYIGVKN